MTGPGPAPVISGTWYVVRTTLPFWRRRTDPTITYAPLPDGRVVDTVRYRNARGTVKLVVGVDEPRSGPSWEWRGTTPLTRLTSSRWRVVEDGEGWAITHFEKTLFTPEGWDVYAREAEPPAEVLTGFGEALARHSVPEVFTPARTEPA